MRAGAGRRGVARRTGRTYGGAMADGNVEASESDVMDMFDADSGAEAGTALVCRVCGSLVAASGAYPQAHWDWHEAPNGA